MNLGDEGQLPERIDAGAHLAIRHWQLSDVAAMRQLITENLDHLRPWMAWARREPISDERRRAMIGGWSRYRKSGDGAVYAVTRDTVPIGGCGLHRRVGPGGVDIGYWLATGATRHGYATAVATALVTAAFDQPTTNFVQISHAADNERSAGVPRRLGFRNITAANDRDATIWRLDRTDWTTESATSTPGSVASAGFPTRE